MEGWSAASLRPSVLSAAVLRYQDLRAGVPVEGEVAAVEPFGLLVKLGEGVRALVPKNHLGDVAVKNPKARFKVRPALLLLFTLFLLKIKRKFLLLTVLIVIWSRSVLQLRRRW